MGHAPPPPSILRGSYSTRHIRGLLVLDISHEGGRRYAAPVGVVPDRLPRWPGLRRPRANQLVQLLRHRVRVPTRRSERRPWLHWSTVQTRERRQAGTAT